MKDTKAIQIKIQAVYLGALAGLNLELKGSPVRHGSAILAIDPKNSTSLKAIATKIMNEANCPDDVDALVIKHGMITVKG